MKNKAVFTAVLLGVLSAVCAAVSIAAHSVNDKDDDTLAVVTSFYPVYIAALNITDGVEGVTLSNLSEPKTGCLHDYQLTAGDVKLLANADLLLVNGGGMESFLRTEGFSEKYPGLTVAAVNENLPKEELDPDNAHYWMDLDLYEIYVQKVAIALADADTEHAGDYMDNYAAYRKKIDALIAEADKLSEDIASNGGKEENAPGAIVMHEAFVYLLEEVGIEPYVILDLDDGASVSAGELSKAAGAVLSGRAGYVFADETWGKETAQALYKETNLTPVYLDPLTTGDYNKDAWLDGMKENLDRIRASIP